MSDVTQKTVLITGATGFFGSHLARRMCKDISNRLVLLSRRGSSVDYHDVTSVNCLLNDLTAGVWQEAGVEKIDIIIHLAAFTPKTTADANRIEEIYRDNLIGTKALLDSLPSAPERIIFASTIDVYAPPPEGNILDENSPLGPIGLYGASKLFCEQLIRVYTQVCHSTCAILRYGHIYGPGEEAYEKLIPQGIRRLLRGESPVLYGDGSAKRDLLYIDDAVEATMRAVFSSENLDPLNVVSGVAHSIQHITEILMSVTGFNGDIVYLRDRPKGTSLSFNNSKMREALGKWHYVELEEGLRREAEYNRAMVQ